MSITRSLAALAALVFWTMAGQAKAVTTFDLSITLTPQNSIYQYSGYNISPSFQTFTIRTSSPVTGFVATSMYLDVVKFLDGKFYMYSDFTTDGFVSLNNQKFGRFQTGCWQARDFFGQWETFQCDLNGPANLWINLENLTQPVSVSLTAWSPSPEPDTWALMILGFGGIGAVMRQRHQTASVNRH